MVNKDFSNITLCKYAVLALQLSSLAFTVISPLLFMDKYFQILVVIEKIYLLLLSYSLIMILQGAYQGLRILKRIEKNEPVCIKNERNIYHAIALPIYQQSVSVLKQTLNRLSKHSKAKTNYLIFLAMEQNSNNPEERAQELQKQFCNSFKQFRFTFHQLQKGEGRGKASNLTWCLKRIEPVFLQNNIKTDDVLFTTIDCDNWAPNAYFEEVELFLSKNEWKMNKYMFAPNQMITINVNEVNLYNRVLDFMLGAIVFLWSNTASKVQNAASNYSISYQSLKQIGFLDTNPDSMCDDYHTSMKFLWKKQETVQIIPIFVMFNMMSLKTGEGLWQDIKARFWQSERHARAILDIAYNLNQFINNPFKFRAVWGSFNFFTNHFFSGLSFSALFFYAVIKLASGQTPLKDELSFIVNAMSLTICAIIVIYYIIINKSAKVLYDQKQGISWRRCIQTLLFHPLAIGTCSITQIIASVRVTVKTPQYDAAPKQESTIN